MALLIRSTAAGNASIEFFGTGPNWADPYIDRIRVLIDAGVDPTFPANVGAGDFTVEMFLFASASNDAGAVTVGANNNWINGNIFFDRDRYGQNRAWGASLGNGRVTFGVYDSNDTQRTIASDPSTGTDIRGAWYHVALVRDISESRISIFVGLPGQTGNREATSTSAGNGDLSYPDGATPNSSCGESANQVCSESDPYMVFGAEKHDAGAEFPSYFGLMTEVRISDSVRYSGTTYSAPSARFEDDANTAALYHMNESSGTSILDDSGNDRHGTMEVGGPSSGPQRSTESPL